MNSKSIRWKKYTKRKCEKKHKTVKLGTNMLITKNGVLLGNGLSYCLHRHCWHCAKV